MFKLFLITLLITIFYCHGIPVLDHSRSQIVGGEKTKFSIPYQVSLEVNNTHVCGGVIISQKAILTAAHCINQSVNYTIRAGTRTRERYGKVVRVSRMKVHSKFDPDNYDYDYDIAILILKKALNFSNVIQAVELPEINETAKVGINATVSGWGFKKEDSQKPTKMLRFAKVPIVDRETCKEYLPNFTERQICAGYLAGGVDACTKDSGGPLVVGKKLFGIVSVGYGCAREEDFGVYTNVQYFRGWIDEILKTIKCKKCSNSNKKKS